MIKKFKSIFDTFKIINNSDKQTVFILFFKNLFSSLTPYIAVYLSSLILNMIIDKRNTDEIIFSSVIGITLLGLCKLISVILTHFVSMSKSKLMFVVEKKVSMKTMDFDYSQLENADIIKSIQKTRENASHGGISAITDHFDNIIKGLFDIAFAVILALPILNNISFLLSPSFIIYLLLVIALIFINFHAANHLADKRKILTDNLFEIYGIADFYMFGENVGYKNGKDIRIFDLFNLVERDVNTFKNSRSRKLIKQIIDNSKITEGNSSLLNGIITVGAFFVVLFYPDSSSYTIGDLLKYAAFIAGLFTGVSLIFSTFTQLTISCVLMQDTVQFLDIPDSLSKGNRSINKSGSHIIEFHDVSFKYENSNIYALKNISLTLKENETYAFVGMNGSGKTTMIKLLCRLYDPTGGYITLDNIDIKEYDYKEYMRFFSVVFQDFKLFSLSLAQNIAVSNIYNEDDVLDCIEKAGFKERYEKMPDGMQSLIYQDMGKEGVEVSGGEEQKIAIARALYKNSPFIILDEPTAALDPISEFEIYSRFNELKKNKTAIFISHRLSSCRFCTDIVVFDEGSIVQKGSHDFLIEDKNGKYYELWNAQSKYYS